VSKRLTISDIVIVVSGVVLLVASFLTWVDYPSLNLGPLGAQLQQLGIDVDIPTGEQNAWDHFPGFVYPAIGGTLAALLVVLGLASVRLGDGVAGFSLTQIYLLLGAWAFLSTLAVALEDFRGADKGIGLWLSLAFSAVLFVGALIRTQERVAAPAAEATPA
jgi:hypothetical protein